MNILIVDDDYIILTELSEYINSLDHSVDVAQSIKEATVILSNKSINLIIIDVRIIRGQDGKELLKELKDNYKQTFILLMTAYPNIDHVLNSINRTDYDYITKPFKLDEIRFCLSKIEAGLLTLS